MAACAVVAVVGHESVGGEGLRGLLDPQVQCAAGGRELYRRVSTARDRGESVCVVPITLGRDPELVADAARTLRALPDVERAGAVLAEPFATASHLIGWLRAAATEVPGDRGLLVTAPSGDPFSDAELFRVARLVRQYGRHRTVEVALLGGDPDLAEGVARCRALGAERVAVLPAGWCAPRLPDAQHAAFTGELLSPQALSGVLAARVSDAWHRHAEHGDDGLASGLMTAHGHGYAHSHASEEPSHTHPHPHPGDDRRPHGHPHHHDEALCGTG